MEFGSEAAEETDQSSLCEGDTLTEEEVMMLINAADKDGDGSLDFEEFVKIMLWYFADL